MTKVVVIGAGIAGLSAAARLSEDAEVIVLEQEKTHGHHASGRSAALYEPNYGAGSVQALNKASFDYLHGHDGGYLTPRGLMLLGKAGESQAFEADFAQMEMQRISPSDAVALVPVLDPNVVQLAAHLDTAQDIDTDRLMSGFLWALRANGGQLMTSHQVTNIGFADDTWTLETQNARFEADILVNAAGPWADTIAKMAGLKPLGIVPHRRSMARVAAPAGYDVSAWPIFFGVSESWYAKPDAGALIISPADEDPTEPHDAWADDMTLAEGIARYQEFAVPPVTSMIANWAGLRSFAPDRTLVLGPDPDHPKFVWCAGQGGYGFQSSPAAAQLVADLAFNRSSSLPQEAIEALRPERLR